LSPLYSRRAARAEIKIFIEARVPFN